MSSVEIIFVGCEKVSGKKKDGGAPYGPFYQVHHVTALNEVNNENRQVSGIGFVPQVSSVAPEVFEQFQHCKPLTKVMIEVAPDPRNFSRSVISGVKVPA